MKPIHVSGKRKTSVARATLREGKGRIRINKIIIDCYEPAIQRLRIREPLLLAGPQIVNKVDIDVNVFGGGIASQAEAARLTIARALAIYDKKTEDIFDDYDRHLLIADVRRKETAKPNSHGAARSKVQKSYR